MTVTATSQRPEYDLTLSDGTTTLGMVAMDQRGQPDPRQLRARPLDRMAIQTTIGESAYSDRVMPYRDIVQEEY